MRSNEKHDRPERDWLAALTAGDKAAWDGFVDRYAGVIHGTARRILGSTGMSADEIGDVVQDVFVRLCRDQFRLLRTYDPERAGLATWVGVIARSVALDARRRLRKATVSLDEIAVEPAVDPPQPRERLKVPADLLTPRQRLVLAMIYDKDMDVARCRQGPWRRRPDRPQHAPQGDRSPARTISPKNNWIERGDVPGCPSVYHDRRWHE